MKQDEQSEPSRWPESDKLGEKVEERNTIVQFLEWAQSNASEHITVYASSTMLAHQYLGVNEEALERERRDMLDELRMLNNGNA